LLEHTDDQSAALGPKVGGAGDAIRSAAVDAQKLLRNVDGQVAPLANSARDTLTSAKDVLAVARGALGQAQKTLSSLTDTASPALKQGEKAFSSVSHLAGEDGVLSNDLGHNLKAIEDGARSIRVLADSLQRNPEALLHGRSK